MKSRDIVNNLLEDDDDFSVKGFAQDPSVGRWFYRDNGGWFTYIWPLRQVDQRERSKFLSDEAGFLCDGWQFSRDVLQSLGQMYIDNEQFEQFSEATPEIISMLRASLPSRYFESIEDDFDMKSVLRDPNLGQWFTREVPWGLQHVKILSRLSDEEKRNLTVLPGVYYRIHTVDDNGRRLVTSNQENAFTTANKLSIHYTRTTPETIAKIKRMFPALVENEEDMSVKSFLPDRFTFHQVYGKKYQWQVLEKGGSSAGYISNIARPGKAEKWKIDKVCEWVDLELDHATRLSYINARFARKEDAAKLLLGFMDTARAKQNTRLIGEMIEDDDFSVKDVSHNKFLFVPVQGREGCNLVYQNINKRNMFLGWLHSYTPTLHWVETHGKVREHCDSEKRFTSRVDAAEYLLRLNVEHS